ncbi:MAG: Holliday junction branch migration protein RuvA [Elusimicrobia bacterium]|nr:Holliday junction branch migration protein RuvA [Elusimicrobiota bacterium]MBU2615075.1 Holliday junction branch migration protein RuvA [Elusimicrobiota bacterium]
MIAFLEGILEEKSVDSVILAVNGIGYDISISAVTYEKLPATGKLAKLYIYETQGIYGGGITLYGFTNLDDKEIFLVFKDGLKNTGSKKALDYMDKATKSLPDFQRAVTQKDTKLLTSIFGFRKPTAEKIVALLNDKLSKVKITGKEKWPSGKTNGNMPEDAIQALVSLGYKEAQARHAVEESLTILENPVNVSEIIKLALRYLQ